MSQHQLLERDAGAEAQRARAQASDRAGGDLDHVHAVTVTVEVQPQLRVYGPLHEADRRAGTCGDDLGATQRLGRQARRRDVDGLLEVGTDERVGLVEHREHGELAVAQQPLDRDLDAGHVLLDQQRPVADHPDAARRRPRRVDVVGADHALAAGAVDRLHHPGEREVGRVGQGRRRVGAIGHDERRLGHLGRAQGPAHRRLVAGGRHRVGRVVREAQALAGGRGHHHAAVVDRHDRVHTSAVVQRHDQLRSGLRLVERHHEGPLGASFEEEGHLVRPDHDLDAEPGGGPYEIGCPVGRCGEQEENAQHAPIMVAVTDVLAISPEAQQKVLEVRNSEAEPDTLALWVEVNGEANGAYTYLMEFRPTAELDADVLVERDGDLAIAIPAESIDLLRGATLAFNGGMVMQNPNRPLPPVARVANRPRSRPVG